MLREPGDPRASPTANLPTPPRPHLAPGQALQEDGARRAEADWLVAVGDAAAAPALSVVGARVAVGLREGPAFMHLGPPGGRCPFPRPPARPPARRRRCTFRQDKHFRKTVWDMQYFCGFRLLVVQQLLWHSWCTSQGSPMTCKVGPVHLLPGQPQNPRAPPAAGFPGAHQPSNAVPLTHSQTGEGGRPGGGAWKVGEGS